MTKKVFIILLVLLCNSITLFSQLRTDKLSRVREEIVFPELTSSEKRLLTEQSKIFFDDLYVNRYQKIEMYGTSPSFKDHVDPNGAIDKILENIDIMTTEEVELGIQQVFVNQRDLHLNYIFPAPYSNYKSILPLTFTRVSNEDNFFEVRVNGLHTELLDLSIGNQRYPEIGDIVVKYNGKSIDEAVKDFMQTAQGANKYGGFSRALGQMTFISHKIHTVPENDRVEITFKSATNGDYYTVIFDWLSQWKELQAEPILVEDSRNTNTNSGKSNYSEDDFLSNDDIWQSEFNKFNMDNNLTTNSIFPKNPTNEPVVNWGLIKRDGKEFGYLNITSFVPKMGTNFAINEIIRVIETYFQNTEALIIDVRNNGGGSIVFADKLSQLFIPGEAKAIQARLLNTELNKYIFNESIFGAFSNPEWTRVINEVSETNKTYSDTAPFTTTSQANEIGQVYYKPVGVITNARSYSATDLFSCAMQDNEAAIIFGEDPQTGAGGANVIEHKLFEEIVGAPFVKLPDGHAMRVSWRQSVRFGHHNGMLIEDHGCYADIDISLTPEDVHDGGKNQLATITSNLVKNNYKYKSYGKSDLLSKKLYLSRDKIEFKLTVANTEHIDLYINNELSKRETVYIYGNEKEFILTLQDNLDSNKQYSIAIVGKDSGNSPLWNTKKTITIIDKKLKLDNNGIVFDFSKANQLSKLSIINSHTNAQDGWNKKGDYLAVGLDPVYKNQIDTDAVIFLDLTDRLSANLTFKLEGLTEIDYDFMTVYVTNASGEKVYFRESGYMPNIDRNYNLSDFAGEDNVAIHFRFISDQMVDAPGIRISNINIR